MEVLIWVSVKNWFSSTTAEPEKHTFVNNVASFNIIKYKYRST